MVAGKGSSVMLLLSRKKSQRVFIDAPRSGRIEIMICAVDSGRVKIGFNAPIDFKIEREELEQRNSDTSVDHCHAG
ncbi:MAG: carbon storage regulator [Bacteroidetes bacterium]|jgi:carbon storage regulator CsrA|nr:MAG: carbon storage regulator [Bacteroidota bacterium]